MNKKLLALGLILVMLLGGCGVPEHPDVAADGTPWGSDWIDVGAVLGIEPQAGWTLQRNEDLLADTGMYFVSWTWGDPIRTAEGETSYPAQVFLVLSGCETAEDAAALTRDWLELVRENYDAQESDTLEHRLGSFTLTRYQFREADASFDLGLSCLGAVGNRSVNLEISCLADTGLDLEQTITAFLNGFHFAD